MVKQINNEDAAATQMSAARRERATLTNMQSIDKKRDYEKKRIRQARKEQGVEVTEAKATMCGRCGTNHVKPEQGGTCPALSKEENARRRSKSMNEGKDPKEYDYEGEMAKVQLMTIIRHAQHLHDMLEDDTTLS